MYDPSLRRRVERLRRLAVDTLTADPNRTLHLEAEHTIETAELVGAAAEQYGVRAPAICSTHCCHFHARAIMIRYYP